MTSTTEQAPERAMPIWRIDTDRIDQQYKAARTELLDWLQANGVKPDDVVDGTSVSVVTLGDALQLETFQAVRELDGSTSVCPSCQHCIRGRQVHTLLTWPMPAVVAAAGWAEPDAPAGWLSQINSRAELQGTPTTEGDNHA